VTHVSDAQLDQVASAQLAIYPEIKERKFPQAALHLKPNSACPDLLKLERRLLADELALIPGSGRDALQVSSMVISFGLKEISNYGESRAASLRPDIAAGGTDAKRGSRPTAN